MLSQYDLRHVSHAKSCTVATDGQTAEVVITTAMIDMADPEYDPVLSKRPLASPSNTWYCTSTSLNGHYGEALYFVVAWRGAIWAAKISNAVYVYQQLSPPDRNGYRWPNSDIHITLALTKDMAVMEQNKAVEKDKLNYSYTCNEGFTYTHTANTSLTITLQ